MQYHNIYKLLYHNESCLRKFEIRICFDTVFFSILGLTLAQNYLVGTKCDSHTKRHIASQSWKSRVSYKVSRIRIQEWRTNNKIKLFFYFIDILFSHLYLSPRFVLSMPIRLIFIKYCWTKFNRSMLSFDKRFDLKEFGLKELIACESR